MEEQGERMYSSYSFMTTVLDEVNDQRHAPAALYPRRKDPLCPVAQSAVRHYTD
jgi:hypothetical protein